MNLCSVKFRLSIAAAAILTVFAVFGVAAGRKTKNVILMIADGRGFNVVQATDYYTGQKTVYESFPQKYGMQTYSAGVRNGTAGSPYNPEAMARSFDYALKAATDSASAATALFTGVKVFDHEVNYTPGNLGLETFFEKAAEAGKSIGSVSSVHWTHATPAAVFAHDRSRIDYASMAKEAIYGRNPGAGNSDYDARNFHGRLKVVMGPGNPGYGNDARPRSGADYSLVGGETSWKDLAGGINGWSLITAQAQFEALVKGRTPEKVFGIPQVFETLQYNRGGLGARNNKDLPYTHPRNSGVPDLATMTRAALNVLDNNRKGFAVMIEGGAIDWANHSNQAGRMIEEQVDFDTAVAAVVDYLDRNTGGNNWNNTLLVVTSDHESGYLWGDGRVEGSTFFDVNDNGAFDHGTDYAHVKDNGPGKLPAVWFHSGNHSNSLVPLYARGAGSGLFEECVVGMEPNLRAIYNLDAGWSGRYIDNTCVFHVMANASLDARQRE